MKERVLVVGVALALGALALGASSDRPERYRLGEADGPAVIRLDTATGEICWIPDPALVPSEGDSAFSERRCAR